MAKQGPWGGGNGGDNGERAEPERPEQPRPDAPRPPSPNEPQRPWGPRPVRGDGPQGPNGQRPGGPRRPEQMPDMEDLVRKGQERLRVLMGGRGGGSVPPGRGRGAGPGFQMGRGQWGIAALAAVGLWAFASFYTVDTSEKSVELLFGSPYAVRDDGLNFAPWPFVTRHVMNVTGERSIDIGNGRDPLDNGLMLTRDQNIVDLGYQVVWNISDPQKYLFNLADPEGTVRAVAESAMRDIVARSELAPILNRDRGVIAQDAVKAIQGTLDSYQSGISIVRVNLGRADPPSEVIDAFRAVQAAQQERDRLEKEADAYANRVLANARGEAAALVEQSEAYRAQSVNDAEGEAARFNSVYDEYVKAPDVTRRRMYLETMEKVLGGVNKVLIEGEGQGVVPYLPLDQLRRAPIAPAAATGGVAGYTPPPPSPTNNAAGGSN